MSDIVKELPLIDRTDLLAGYVRDHPEDKSYFTSVLNERLNSDPKVPSETNVPEEAPTSSRELRWDARTQKRLERAELSLTAMSRDTFDALSMEDLIFALYSWASVCVFNPQPFMSLASFINEPLQQQKKVTGHFSYKTALRLDPDWANAASNKEKAKIENYQCFTGEYEGTPNFSDGSCIKMYPTFPFRYKTNAVTGENESMSGRLAVNGKDEKGVPDEEKSTHTADQEFVNLAKAAIMAYFVQAGLLKLFFCNSFDVDGAFLHVTYTGLQKIYVQFPKDFPWPSYAGKLLLMLKAVYGVQRSNAMFSVELDNCMTEAGFVPLGIDRAIYIRLGPDGKPGSLCLIHVDDGQMLSCYPEHWTRLVEVMERRFGPLKKVIPSKGHVGINSIFYPDGSFSTNKEGYIWKALQTVDPENKLVPVKTPSLKDLFVDDETSPSINLNWHQQLIGLLIYMLHTRSDIQKEVLYMAKRTKNPTVHDLHKVTRIFAYLKGTPGLGPVYHSSIGPVLNASVDASYDAHPTSHSHDGNGLFIGPGGPIGCRSKKQTESISTSATESEYVAITYVAKSVIRCRQFLLEMGFPQNSPTIIYCDCKSAVSMVKSHDVNKKSQHIQVKFNYIKELQRTKQIDVVHINREYQRADFLGGRELTPSEFVRQRAIFMAGADPEESSKTHKQVTVLKEGVVSEIMPDDLMPDDLMR